LRKKDIHGEHAQNVRDKHNLNHPYTYIYHEYWAYKNINISLYLLILRMYSPDQKAERIMQAADASMRSEGEMGIGQRQQQQQRAAAARRGRRSNLESGRWFTAFSELFFPKILVPTCLNRYLRWRQILAWRAER
jgi:hypothetical protein